MRHLSHRARPRRRAGVLAVLMLAPVAAGQGEPSSAHRDGAPPLPEEGRRALLEDASSRADRGNYWWEEAGSRAAAEKALVVDGELQFRYMWTRRNRPGLEDAAGFGFRRARIGFSGELTDWLSYSVEGAFGRNGGQMRLNDASMRFKLDEDWSLTIGRFRPDFLREEEVSNKRQLLADRSLLASQLGQPRARGLEAGYDGDRLHLRGSIMDGSEMFGADERWLLGARAEVLLAGKWKMFKDYTAEPDQKLGVMLGGGLYYEDVNSRFPFSPDLQSVRTTIDLNAEYRGLSGMAALITDRINDDLLASPQDVWGFVVQGGYRLNEEWELALRYEYGQADGLARDLSIITVGVNWYISGQALKLTGDVGFALNEVNGFWSSTSSGWLTDRAGNDGQTAFRTQLQLLF